MKWTITFQQPSQVPTLDPAIVWQFPFTLVDSSLIGLPEENRKTTPHVIRVKVDGLLAIDMGFRFIRSSEETDRVKEDRRNLKKVLFEYGKRYIIQKLKQTDTLDRDEKFILDPKTTETPSLFDPERIDEPDGASYEIDTDPPSNRSASVNISTNNGDVIIGGDVVGGDKLTTNTKL